MKNQKNYEMLPEKGTSLFRIRALRDIPEYAVMKGQHGGLIEKEENLSQEGYGWVSYSSMVTEDAKVINAHLEKKSHAQNNAHLTSGVVIGSIIRGDSLIEGEYLIEACEIDDSSLHVGGKIISSAIEKLSVRNGAYISDSWIRSVEGIEMIEKVILNSVYLDVNEGMVIEEISWKHVKVRSSHLVIEEAIQMTYVDAVATDNFWIKRNDVKNAIESKMKGTEKSAILIRVDDFIMENSVIEGGTIEGKMYLSASTIRDMAHVRMSGRLDDCHLSEMASIDLPMHDDNQVANLTLGCDMVYKG